MMFLQLKILFINEPVADINADDYYGKEVYVKVHDWLVEKHKNNAISTGEFILMNKFFYNGGVARGV